MACPAHPTVGSPLERCVRCDGEFCRDCVVFLRDRPYCMACKHEQVRDLLSGVMPGALDLASTGRRFAGLWIDSFVTTLAAYALILPLALVFGIASAGAGPESAGGAPMMLMLAIYPILLGAPVVYEGLMLARRGQTLGKMAVGIKVVTPEGGDLSRGQAWGRAALKLVLGSCMGIDYIPAFLTRERTCLHDLMVKTRVVRVR